MDIISKDVELVTINSPLQFAQHEERCRSLCFQINAAAKLHFKNLQNLANEISRCQGKQ